ncbi:SIMPL domain-containing protein [Natrialbaceae archaeon A-gly3]
MLFGTVGTTAAALAGCLGSAEDGEGAGDGSARTITVRESGEVSTEPDLAVVRTGVEATGDDAETVRDELATRSDALHDALIEYGIDEDDITTDRFDVRQRLDRRRMEEDGVDPAADEEIQEYIYYEGTHSFTVEIHDVDAVGEVIDTAVDARADDVGRVRFTLSEEKREQLRDQALEDALEGARSEAEFVASEVDAVVVEARRIDTSGGDVSPVTERVDEVAEDADTPTTVLHPDDVTVTGTVSIEYEIE